MGKAITIGASLLSADFARLAEEISSVERAGVDLIHVDVMDGHFVPNITFGPSVVESLRKVTTLPLDVHLMTYQPERLVERFAHAGADWITVHAEATPHLHRAIALVQDCHVKVGVALNPATPIWAVEDVIEDIDLLLVMSVNPGFGGQKFIPHTLEKLRRLSQLLKAHPGVAESLQIEVDGGVNSCNARELCSAGASVLVAGSSIFLREDRAKAVQEIREAALAGRALMVE
ncbi:MAG: ribulose-phosphate 3-epimerase [Bacillota bacterium]